MISKDDFPEEVFKDVDNFITGSLRFSTENENSDMDICIVVSSSKIIRDRLKDSVISESDYNNGYKFTNSGKIFNVVPLHPLDYVCWYHSAKLMELIPRKDKKSRPELHGLHEMIVGVMKYQFAGELIGLSNYKQFLDKENS